MRRGDLAQLAGLSPPSSACPAPALAALALRPHATHALPPAFCLTAAPPAPGRYWRYAHGACWADLCDDLEVVDVPGDHFSLLRQEPADMELLVTALKAKLGAFGWAESVRRDRRQEYRMSAQVGLWGQAGWRLAALRSCCCCCGK